MMTFKERLAYIAEVKKKYDNHPDGTYISVTLSKQSQDELNDWVDKNDIPNATDPKEYHSTVIYSRKGIPEASDYDLNLPLDAKISGWKIFHTQNKTNALVAIMDSPELTKHHVTIREKYGATHDFPDYHPHVTVSYDYGDGPEPKEVPSLKLHYDSSEFKPLNPDFVPPKKDA